MKPWITFLLVLTMATTVNAQVRGGGMRGGGMRGHVGAGANIPRVVGPFTPGNRGIPPVVSPLPPVDRGIGFRTGIDNRRGFVGRGFVGPGFGNAFSPFRPGFRALAARQVEIGPQIGFYPFSYPYTYPFPYTPPLGSPYYPAPVYVKPPPIVQSYENTTDDLVDEVQQLRNQVQQLSDELTIARSVPVPAAPVANPQPPGPPTVL